MSEWYWVTGINPEPWTPGTAFRRGKGAGIAKDGKLLAYQSALAEEFEIQNPHFLLRSGELSVTFYFWRSTAYGNVADATNLQKATEDALQKILYVNDRGNRRVCSDVVEQGPSVQPHIMIVIEEWTKPEIEVPASVIVPKYSDTDWIEPDGEPF